MPSCQQHEKDASPGGEESPPQHSPADRYVCFVSIHCCTCVCSRLCDHCFVCVCEREKAAMPAVCFFLRDCACCAFNAGAVFWARVFCNVRHRQQLLHSDSGLAQATAADDRCFDIRIFFLSFSSVDCFAAVWKPPSALATTPTCVEVGATWRVQPRTTPPAK
jgi:hypothetical protein